MPKSYLFAVMQYENHPKTGEPLLSEEQIKKCIAHKTIGKWAYIRHDKDVYSEKDEIDDPEKIAGTTKPPHWHIVLRTKTNQLEIGVIAKWLGIAENYVEIKPATAFLDLIEYLTHEHQNQQELGKHHYEDDEIIANFDFRGMLDQRKENALKYGRTEISKIDQWIFDLNQGNKTLKQCYFEDPILYGNNEEKLRRNRKIFLQMQKPPANRMNVYVGGKRRDGSSGGLGKSLASRAIARQLGRTLGYTDWDDEDLFFIVGADNVTFEGYDGQPIIIWDDCKAVNVLKKLGSRENVYNVFDTNPAPVSQRQNIKGSYVPMNQTCNIISSSQEPIEFLDGLAGEFKDKDGKTHQADDKSQIYRRIQICMLLHEEDYELMFNKGYFSGSSDYLEYERYRGLIGNFKDVRVALKNNPQMLIDTEMRMTKKIGDKVKEKIESETKVKNTDNSQFLLYGKSKEEVKEELQKNLSAMAEMREGLQNGTLQYRDDITEAEVEQYKNDVFDLVAQLYKAMDKLGLVDDFDKHLQKQAKLRAIDEWNKRHADKCDIPTGREYEEEIEGIMQEIGGANQEMLAEAKRRMKTVDDIVIDAGFVEIAETPFDDNPDSPFTQYTLKAKDDE